MKNGLIALILLILTGCATSPKIIQYDAQKHAAAPKDKTIYIVNHGWHTGIIVSAQQLNKVLPELQHYFKQAKFYEIGWGDAGFYQAGEVTFLLTIQAIFWPTNTVMHVVALPLSPEKYFPKSKVVKLKLSDSGLQNVLKFIQTSFYKSKQDKLEKLGEGLYGNSLFFKATGSYYMCNTCNKWTAKGLKSGGIPIGTTFKFRASSVMDSIKNEEKK